MSGKLYPRGSTAALRADVLRVLGVLKVATPSQIQRLSAPHLSYRYSHLPEARRKSARNKAHRNAAADLSDRRQTTEAGFTVGREKLWRLTPAGLKEAAGVLARPMDEMGGTARGAGTTGAPHAMAVNETIIAFIQPAPDLYKLDGEPEEAIEAARSIPPGIGSITSWFTEVPLPPAGTWSRPGTGGAQADAVFTDLETNLPLLCVEVDNGWMAPHTIAAKFAKYQRFYRRKVVDTDGRERPMWQTRWGTPRRSAGEAHPPVALVFTGRGERSLAQRMQAVQELSRAFWAGRHQGDIGGSGFTDYADAIPILATTLARLQQYGPQGRTWWRFGHQPWEPLTQALNNPDDYRSQRRCCGGAIRNIHTWTEGDQTVTAVTPAWSAPLSTKWGT